MHRVLLPLCWGRGQSSPHTTGDGFIPAEGREAKSLSPRVSLAGNGFLTRFTQPSLEPARAALHPKTITMGSSREPPVPLSPSSSAVTLLKSG